MRDGKIIGAVGASGGTAQQDGITAKACADLLSKKPVDLTGAGR